MSQIIPNKFYIVKIIYDNFGLKYTTTRNILEIGITRQSLYYIRDLLDNVLWYDKLEDYNGEKVYAKGSEKLSRYWRISDKSLYILYKYFNIITNIDKLAKYILK